MQARLRDHDRKRANRGDALRDDDDPAAPSSDDERAKKPSASAYAAAAARRRLLTRATSSSAATAGGGGGGAVPSSSLRVLWQNVAPLAAAHFFGDLVAVRPRLARLRGGYASHVF